MNQNLGYAYLHGRGGTEAGHGRSFWKLLTDDTPGALPFSKPEHTNPIHCQHRSPGTWATSSLPYGALWVSSNTHPPIGNGAGAADEALPTLGRLTGVPFPVNPFM